MIHPIIPRLHKGQILAVILLLASPSVANALDNADPTQPPSSPPITDSAPGTAPEDPGTNAPSNGGNQYSDEDYDSSAEPFGRGCPFQDDNLGLIT